MCVCARACININTCFFNNVNKQIEINTCMYVISFMKQMPKCILIIAYANAYEHVFMAMGHGSECRFVASFHNCISMFRPDSLNLQVCLGKETVVAGHACQ